MGLREEERQIVIITGVNNRTTASFTRNALEIPVAKTTMMSRRDCVLLQAMVLVANQEKKPSNCRVVMMIIIPSRSAMVLKSIAFTASSKLNTPNTIIATAPK